MHKRPNRVRGIRVVGLFASILILLEWGHPDARLAGAQSPAPGLTPSQAAPPSVVPGDTLDQASIYERLLASAVWIVHPYEKDGDSGFVTGTGWLVDRPNRLIVTNHHVVLRGDDSGQIVPDELIRVYFPAHRNGRLDTSKDSYINQGTFQKARVVDSDPTRDLAVLQLVDLPAAAAALPLSARPIRPGETVHLIGSPRGTGAMWIYTSGTVRQVYQVEKEAMGPHQTTTYLRVESQLPTNPGDSGGPVLNNRGEVVAIHHSHNTEEQVRLMARHVDVSELKDFLSEVRPLLSTRTAEDWLARGERDLERDRLDLAIADFTEALKREPDLAAALYGRGHAFYTKGDYETALSDLDEAVAKGASNLGNCHNLRGLCYDAMERLKPAITAFTQAIRQEPGDSVLYANRGDTYRKNKDYERATTDLQEAIRLDPGASKPHLYLGIVHHNQKRYEQAISEYQEALKLASEAEAAPILYNLGNAFFDSDQRDRAYAAFDVLEKVDPEYAEQNKEQFDRRYLVVENRTGDKLVVSMKFHTFTMDGDWQWFPTPPDQDGWEAFEMEPGQRGFMRDEDGFLINADRVRIFAMTPDNQRGIVEYRDRDLQIAPEDGYQDIRMRAFEHVLGGSK